MAARFGAGSPEAAQDNADTERGWFHEGRAPAAENRRIREPHPRMALVIRTCRLEEELHEAVAGSDYGCPAPRLGAGVQNTPVLDASARFRRTIQHGQEVPPRFWRQPLVQTLRIGAGSAPEQKHSARRSFAR